jgi:hypothetical protein
MTRVFTPATIEEIIKRARRGANARTIATELGLNHASLRVKCSQLGISLRKCRASGQDPASQTTSSKIIQVPVCGKQINGPLSTRTVPTSPQTDSLVIVVSGLTAQRLHRWGMAKGMTAETLAARLLTVIANDGLYKAILDDDAA